MKRNFISKCLISLGLLLFCIVLNAATAQPVTAQAASTEKDKSDTYRLSLKSITLVKGKTFTLRVFNASDARISFKSEDSEIASVNDDGDIYARRVGETDIHAIIKYGSDSDSLTCHVTVGPPAVSVKWTHSRVIIGIDRTDTLNVILKPSNTAEDAKFSSQDSSIVSISSGGRITARSYGFTYLFAEIDADDSDGSSKYDTCGVIVTSHDNVSKLEDYFNDHPELDKIPESELNRALSKFFNNEFDQSSLISDLNRYLKKVFDL